jgi:erythromycin esterase
MDFARYVAEHVIPLDTVDPAAPLDDLEPLAGRLEAARVIAIGENAHLVREFYQLRHRLHRFLTQRLGFTVYAMESGFSEGLTVDAWVRGERPAGDLRKVADEDITYTMGRCREMREHLTWMRTATPPVRFFGLDVPGSTASALPAIEGLRRYLRQVDPDAEPVLDRLAAMVGTYAGEHSLPAYTAYSGLAAAERDRITATWAELAARFDALEPEYQAAGNAESYAIVATRLGSQYLSVGAPAPAAGPSRTALMPRPRAAWLPSVRTSRSRKRTASRRRYRRSCVWWICARHGPPWSAALRTASGSSTGTSVCRPSTPSTS